jgi:hypothetical protein
MTGLPAWKPPKSLIIPCGQPLTSGISSNGFMVWGDSINYGFFE